MKYLYIFSITLFTACSGQNNIDANTSTEISKDETQINPVLENLSANEFKSKLAEGNAILLDVRTPEETGVSFIEDASFINFYDDDFTDKINAMDKSKSIFVYCKGGGRSAKAAEMLVESGFKTVYNLDEGIIAWEASNFALTQGSQTTQTNEKQWKEAEFNTQIKKSGAQLIVFKTKWCAPCRKLDKSLDSLRTNDNFNAITTIDFDANKSIAEKLSIHSVPTIVYFEDGKEVWKELGFKSYAELKQKIGL